LNLQVFIKKINVFSDVYAAIPLIIRLYYITLDHKPNLYKMKRTIIYSVMILMAIIITTGLSAGQTGKETRKVSDFKEISFGVAGNLYVKLGNQFSVVLEGDRDYIEEIETYVRDGKLIIRKENNWNFNNGKVDCYITMPSISGLGVSGSGKARIESAVEADKFSMSVSGSGKVYVGDLEADTFDASISGSGDLIIEGKGTADSGKISISGSGNYNGEGFEIDHLTVNVSGSGNCSCKAGDTLIARISGSGDVYYSGNPKIDARASGSGHIRSR
jgi:hypothetical protein